MFNYIEYDAYIVFKRPYRIDHMQNVALQVPGVKAAESWAFNTAMVACWQIEVSSCTSSELNPPG